MGSLVEQLDSYAFWAARHRHRQSPAKGCGLYGNFFAPAVSGARRTLSAYRILQWPRGQRLECMDWSHGECK